jgi:hypothetical protein
MKGRPIIPRGRRDATSVADIPQYGDVTDRLHDDPPCPVSSEPISVPISYGKEREFLRRGYGEICPLASSMTTCVIIPGTARRGDV